MTEDFEALEQAVADLAGLVRHMGQVLSGLRRERSLIALQQPFARRRYASTSGMTR
jgi:hypothetical protein